ALLHTLNLRENFFFRALRCEFRLAPLFFNQGKKFFSIVSANVLSVEPRQLVIVEDGVRFGDAIEREELYEFIRAEDLAVLAFSILAGSAGSPSQQRQKVPESFGHYTQLLIRDHAGCTMALGKSRLVRAKNQRNMRKDGQWRIQCQILQNLLRCIRDVVRAANDMRQAHVDIV